MDVKEAVKKKSETKKKRSEWRDALLLAVPRIPCQKARILFLLGGKDIPGLVDRLRHAVDDLVPLEAARLEDRVGDGGAGVPRVLLEGVRILVLIEVGERVVHSAVSGL